MVGLSSQVKSSSCLGGRIHHNFFRFLFPSPELIIKRDDRIEEKKKKTKKGPWQPTELNPLPRVVKINQIQNSSIFLGFSAFSLCAS